MCMFMRVDMCVMYVSFCVQYKVYARTLGKLPQEKDHWYTAPYPIPCLCGRGILLTP